MKLADDAVSFHLAHGVEGNQPVGIFLHKSRVITAVRNFVLGAVEIVATMGDYVMAGFLLTAVDQQLPPERKALLPVK